MEPDVLFLSTHRLRKEVESLLQGRALGSALPVFTTAILGDPLPQSLLPYFQVFECCSQTTAVLLKAEPKQATSHCSSLTSHSWASNPSLLLFTHPEFHTHPQATGGLCPCSSAGTFLLTLCPPAGSSAVSWQCAPYPSSWANYFPMKLLWVPPPFILGEPCSKSSCDTLRLWAGIKNKYQLPFLS